MPKMMEWLVFFGPKATLFMFFLKVVNCQFPLIKDRVNTNSVIGQ